MTPLAIALIVLVAMFLLGLPIFMSLIISSVVAILAGGDILPLSVIHNSLFDGLNLFPLLAIPCFVVAGTLMEFGNITQQIVDVVKQLVGRVYGGLGITTILACTFFAAISGSGPGTVAAVGTILVPAMVRNGYSKDYASAAASSGGTIGILIPPSNPMIIYAILGNLSVTAMFTAGFIPGFIVAFAMIMTAYLLAKRNGFKGDENAAPFNMKFFLRSCGNAGFALATPFIILGSIYTGWATPVEASVVAIVWALFVGIVINRVLRPRHIYRALLEGAMTCGAVLLIVGASTLFGKILTFEEAPQRLASIVLGISDDPHLVLLMIIGVLYVLGMFMETLATIIILVPAMVRNGYSKDYASAAASSGGTIGILIPPSNPMIIYAILGNLSVTAMFTAGFIPGFIVAFAMIMTAYLLAKRNGFKGDENAAPFNMKFFLRSCGNAGFALATPFIILGSIYTGWATPVEASVVAIVWALFVGIVINRVLRPRHIYRALLEGAMTCGAVLLIVGASTLFGKILTFEEAPQRLASIVLGISDDPHLVLLMIIGVLYVLGMFMETLATIIILVPVLLPMILQLGIDPIHFGIVLVVTNNVAMLTPPLGVNLFVASRIAGISVERISVAVIPYLIALTLCILLFTYVPAISTWLPSLMGYGQ